MWKGEHAGSSQLLTANNMATDVSKASMAHERRPWRNEGTCAIVPLLYGGRQDDTSRKREHSTGEFDLSHGADTWPFSGVPNPARQTRAVCDRRHRATGTDSHTSACACKHMMPRRLIQAQDHLGRTRGAKNVKSPRRQENKFRSFSSRGKVIVW